MILLLRALVRLVAFLLLVLLALAGLAAAVFSIQGGDTGLSLPALADLLSLDRLERTVGSWFSGLEGSGPSNEVEALPGLGAVLLGLLLLVGVLAPRRERLVTLRSTGDGDIAARRRALAQLATSLAESARGVTSARVKVKPRRTGNGGRLTVRADRPRSADEDAVEREVEERLEPVTGPFGLRARVTTRLGESGARVQ